MKPIFIFCICFFIAVDSLVAADLTLTCSTNDKGKAIVLDSTKPSKTFLVPRLKTKFSAKIANLKNQKSTVKANSKLSPQKKQAKLAAIKVKSDSAKAALKLVKSCKNGAAMVRTQLLVDNFRCYNTELFHDCSIHGSLLVQANSSLCAQSRTIIVKKDSVPHSEGSTTSNSVAGTWNADIDMFPGAGTYTIELLERETAEVKCVSAVNTYVVNENGEAQLISEVY